MSVTWWLTEKIAALFLSHRDCETVLGDLMERQESDILRLFDMLGLLLYREAARWRDWRSWACGVALPVAGSFMLMGLSLAVTRSWLDVIGAETSHTPLDAAVFIRLTGQALMLLGCAWSSGFVVASSPGRSLQVSFLLCCLPCCFCLARFHIESLSPVCLLLFLIPALCGGLYGIRIRRLGFPVAAAVAVCVTITTLVPWSADTSRWSPTTWLLQVAMTLPAWYLLGDARASHAQGQPN